MNPQTQERRVVDPILLQVMTNTIYSIADEMMAALVRTSFSTNIKDRRDCSGAIFSPDCQLVAQGEIGTPLHLGLMLPVVRNALKVILPESLAPGDVILVNSPYPEGPGHLNDLTLVSPVFAQGALVAFLANMAHHVDVGGFAPGSMPFGVWEHYQEGLQIPPVFLARGGRLDEQLIRLLSLNVRTPKEFKGDLNAQIAANNVGEKRIQSVVEKYGIETMISYMQEIMNYSERRIRCALRELPEGSYIYEDYLEGDGIRTDKIAIRLNLRISQQLIEADFSDSNPQVLGPLNCRPPSVRSCVYYVVKTLLDPGLPPNSGAFRPISVITKPGTLLEVEYPGAVCNSNILTTQRLVDCLMGAFSQVLPDRVCSACSGTMNLLNIGGWDSKRGELYNYIETYGGGQGALLWRDGCSAVQTHMTNTRNAPVEAIEAAYPLLVHEYSLVPESAGAGEHRGGFGMKRDIEIQSERTTVTLSSDRFEIGPWGLFEGQSGYPGRCCLENPDGSREILPSKVSRRVERGCRLISATPGGGGRGDAYRRDPEAVRIDVLEQLISRETALITYGVVLRHDLSVDIQATETQRCQHPVEMGRRPDVDATFVPG